MISFGTHSSPSPIGSARKINFATIYQLGWSFLRWANSLRPAAGPVEIGVSGTNKGHNEPPFIWFTPSPGARQRLSKSTNWQQIFQLFCFAPYLWKSPNIPLSRRGGDGDLRLDQLMFVYKSLDIIYLFPLFWFQLWLCLPIAEW